MATATSVEFLRNAFVYNTGDVAGIHPADARVLAARGVVTILDTVEVRDEPRRLRDYAGHGAADARIDGIFSLPRDGHVSPHTHDENGTVIQ